MYSSKLVRIPVPRFVVFYNGTLKQPERKILKLSDMFEKPVEEPELELKVLMLNINLGNNSSLLEKCRTLREYCIYVERVRSYAKEQPIQDAVERAVNECIREGILKDFLLRNKSEVVAMSIFEYDEESELKKIRQDEYEMGMERGRELGKMEGLEFGKQEAMEQGIQILIETCQEMGLTKEEICSKVRDRFSLPEEDAQKFLARFWK